MVDQASGLDLPADVPPLKGLKGGHSYIISNITPCPPAVHTLVTHSRAEQTISTGACRGAARAVASSSRVLAAGRDPHSWKTPPIPSEFAPLVRSTRSLRLEGNMFRVPCHDLPNRAVEPPLGTWTLSLDCWRRRAPTRGGWAGVLDELPPPGGASAGGNRLNFV